MNRDEDVKNIVDQLQRLQLQQSNLISRLERLSEGEPTRTSTARDFAIGDQVRIKNPGYRQATRGTIVKIGKRITVETDSKKKIIRTAKNLTLEEDE